MMEPTPTTPNRAAGIMNRFQYRSDLRVLLRLLGWISVVAYAAFLIHWGTSYASSSDASGYFNSAKLFGELRLVDHIDPVASATPQPWNFQYQQPLGFTVLDATGRMAPTYPIGMPLLLLASAKVVGWDHAAIMLNVLGALGCGWLVWRLGRDQCGLHGGWAALAIVILWLSPLFLFLSLQPMSDMPATYWTLLSIYAAAKTSKRSAWGWLAGAAVGMAVLVRPTNLLVLLPVLILIGRNWRAWLSCLGGGSPFAVALLAYNTAVYGRPLSSGYGDVSYLFSTDFLKHNLLHFAHWIPQLATPLVALTAGFPLLLRKHPRVALALAAWSAALVGFYAFYYHSGETWWYLRFILPAFPCVILLALMVAQHICRRCESSPAGRIIIAGLMLLAALQLTTTSRRLHVLSIREAESAYFHAITWIEARVPARATMVAMQMSGALHFYSEHPLLRYDMIPPDQFPNAVAVARADGREIYAPLFPFELPRVVEAKLGGDWEQVATTDYISIWRLKP